MSRALVLGGGGPIGIGWEAGLIVGLAQAGIDVSTADLVVGTSAGSVVGVTLASGADLSESVALVGQATIAAGGLDAAAAAESMEQLMAALAGSAGDPAAARAVRAEVGRMAMEAATLSEDVYLEMFSSFAGADWPASFCCTAVDVADGEFRVWTSADGAAGVELRRALASSCSVPTIFPPVAIGSGLWMDGGMRDIVNADLAAGHETVLVVSCTLLESPEGMPLPEVDAFFAGTRALIAGLAEAGSRVETITPGAEMLEISNWGLNLMDFAQAPAAYEAGLRQGKVEADRLGRFWTV